MLNKHVSSRMVLYLPALFAAVLMSFHALWYGSHKHTHMCACWENMRKLRLVTFSGPWSDIVTRQFNCDRLMPGATSGLISEVLVFTMCLFLKRRRDG